MWVSQHAISLRSTRWTVSSLCLAVLLAAFAVAACDSTVHTTAPDLLAPGAEALLAQTKVDVCHRKQDGTYVKITIADAAYDTHIEHGDQAVGSGGLDADCQPLPCPCFTAESLAEDVGAGSLLDFVDGENWFTALVDAASPDDEMAWAQRLDGAHSCQALSGPTISDISKTQGEFCRQLVLDYEL